MAHRDAKKFVFRTSIGSFYCMVMPFGLKNAGLTYQRTMTVIFHGMLHHEMEDYMDDIVVKSRKHEDHIKVLKKVFEWCRPFKLRMNLLK